jgi:lipopolysaccharide cholinephosphotransferase
MFWSIKDYDAYLSFKFGDYMKLPPAKKRKVHPVTVLQLLDGK